MGSRTQRSLEDLEVKHTGLCSNLIKCVPLGKGSQALLEGGSTYYLYKHIISQQVWLEMHGSLQTHGPGLAGTVQGLDSGARVLGPSHRPLNLSFLVPQKGGGLDIKLFPLSSPVGATMGPGLLT